MSDLTKEIILKKAVPFKKTLQSYIYFLIKDNKIIYVGQTNYGTARVHAQAKTKDFDKVYLFKVDKSELKKTENYYIRKFNPILNIQRPREIKDLKRLVTDIPLNLFNQFKSKASQDGRTMRKIVIEFIKEYLK